jgi:MSHA biogenesis protein MshN
MQVLEQASAAGVQDAKLSMAQAALALKQQNWAQALTYLQYEPDIFTYSDFYAMKAAALQKTGQHAQAVQVFQQLARQHPDQARWWLGMALSYDALQQQQQALVAYRQALVSGSALSVASVDYVKKRISALE